MKNCREREDMLGAYVDGELDLGGSLELEAHLATCAECSTHVSDLRRLSRTIRSHATRHVPSSHLTNSLRASVAPGRRPVPRTDATVGRRRTASALILAAAVVAAWMGGAWWARPSPERRLGEDVVAAHVRSLQGEHLVDVASSDRHTVNPWFQGKVSFAVGAEDFAARGFALEGARLDYVGGSSVAALVYRHGKHVLNVFEWPADGDAGAQARLVILRGYATQHWTDRGLNVWVVTDADASTLAELTALLRHEAP